MSANIQYTLTDTETESFASFKRKIEIEDSIDFDKKRKIETEDSVDFENTHSYVVFNHNTTTYDAILFQFSDIYVKQNISEGSQNIKLQIHKCIKKSMNDSPTPKYVIPSGMLAKIVYDSVIITCIITDVGSEHPIMSGGSGIYFLQKLELKCSSHRVMNDFIMKCQKSDKSYVFTFDTNFWSISCEIIKRNVETLKLNNVNEKIFKDIEVFEKGKKDYELFGENYKRTYLFTGKPGTGKSSMIKILASKMECSVYTLSFSLEMTDTILQRAITQLPRCDRYILLLEDIDCAFKSKSSGTQDNITNVSHSCIYNLLDGLNTGNNVITVITSNHPERLDKTLIRPGRVDMRVHFENVNEQQLLDLLTLHKRLLSESTFKKMLTLCLAYDLGASAVTNFLFRNRFIESDEFNQICDVEFKKYLEEMGLTESHFDTKMHMYG